MKIYFHAMENFFHPKKIYFHAEELLGERALGRGLRVSNGNESDLRHISVICTEGLSAEDVDLCRSSVTKSLVHSLNGNEEVR